jgi:DNA-binding PadR family transcriptional regulator
LTNEPIDDIISLIDIPIYDTATFDTQEQHMTKKDEFSKYLPLTEATYYIMLSLVKPQHGYAVMQTVETMSLGTVKVGPGTLYGVFATLEKEKIIAKVKEEDRRKVYTLTPKGKKILVAQIRRLEIMTHNGLQSSILDE